MSIEITGVGSCIPEKVVKNSDFLNHEFLNQDGTPIKGENDVIIRKFKAITGIDERRYVEDNLTASDLAGIAAQNAIKDAGIDKETIDYIIVAQNFGDVKHKNTQSDAVPSLASRVKHILQIKNPSCVGYDLVFGCPGWLEGVIHAKAFIKAGMAKKCLVIGTETLSRVVDAHDRDSMIFSDGAGATIIEDTGRDNAGIIGNKSATYANDEAYYLAFEASYNQELQRETRYIKMNGRMIYNFALTYVPQAMKSCLEESGIDIKDLKKIFIHQANEKMDQAICERFYKLYDLEMPEYVMPMSIAELGNSSVATLPTLLDLVKRKQIENQEIKKGDVVLFASVGAGMNINALTYKI
ncbi:3-oxoacyl-[acyl-carrier-protein] synthase-3 [Mesonia phycicola]|uniref:3-oxoacyl-[acyl-carrier-protein] synthase-3 n=1 Tax=Mesonia phycicola TaxID=579105 RepID=A0A1M6H4Y7_9FLAO|nr:ketoacyl-ACP synthase III [Mesonia phycicola]SHJ17264.1 3-oxoacyl-[acyl-carrier-protein] synthase-3 [Mesonia phycicola]